MGELVLDVYKDSGVWVFDDPERRFAREPLLFGMEKMIAGFAATLRYADQGFQLSISEEPGKNPAGVLVREEADAGGYWYRSSFGSRGWMGNRGLLRYFSAPPATIYYSARPRPSRP